MADGGARVCAIPCSGHQRRHLSHQHSDPRVTPPSPGISMSEQRIPGEEPLTGPCISATEVESHGESKARPRSVASFGCRPMSVSPRSLRRSAYQTRLCARFAEAHRPPALPDRPRRGFARGRTGRNLIDQVSPSIAGHVVVAPLAPRIRIVGNLPQRVTSESFIC